MFDFFADSPFVFKNVAEIFAFVEALQNGVDRVDEIENGDLGARSRGFGVEFELAGDAREDVFLPSFEILELGGGVLEFFVFDQLADEFPAGIFPVFFASRAASMLPPGAKILSGSSNRITS